MNKIKRILSTFFILGLVCLGVQAKEYNKVCANHILVPTEMDAIKLKSQINTFEDFQKFAKLYSECLI